MFEQQDIISDDRFRKTIKSSFGGLMVIYVLKDLLVKIEEYEKVNGVGSADNHVIYILSLLYSDNYIN